jgi:hypothetical protein
MCEFELVLSEAFKPREGQAIAAQLRSSLPIDQPRYYMRKSASDLPQFIELIASADLWKTTLGVACTAFITAYVARLGYRAAEASADFVAGLFKAEDVAPLAGTIMALSDARSQVIPKATLRIGLDVPNRRTPTILEISANDPADVALAISKFIQNVDQISEAMAREAEAGRVPITQASVSFSPDQAIELSWQYWLPDHNIGAHTIKIR